MIALFFLFPFSLFSSYNAHKAYRQNNLVEAQELLEKEQVERPNDPLVNYNLGTTYYKQKKYDLAKKSFGRAATHEFANNNDSNNLVEKSRFNLGNCFYKQALAQLPENWEKEQLDNHTLEQAAGEVQQAIEQYKSTLSANKHNERAQTNKKAAETLLAKLIKQQQQQKQKKKQDQSKQDQKQPKQQDKKEQQPQKKLDKHDKKESMEKRRVRVLLNKLQDQEKKLQKKLFKEKVKADAKPKNSYQKPW